ncbi:MAG: site-specific DNA-methyltransferase [Pseudomonadales bacterium]|nr:site-specific DNA-methyltransferase [Pseudomonadales bacterium]
MNQLKMHSPNLTEDNIARIRDLFPGCVTEARGEDGSVKLAVDFDQLRQELSASLVEGPQERYHLNWPGKREALLTANAPIAKTLRPCREESVDFDTTKNLFIEGDNLDALKLLQETYLGKVKLIYIDPPYNTGNDFIYEDDFAEDAGEYLRRSNQVDDEGNRLAANTAANGRFHSDWLTMMYSRLRLASRLLADDGVLFISIGDDEVGSLRTLCGEIFGEQNYISQVTRIAKRTSDKGTHFRPTKDHVLVYAKQIELLAEFGIPKEREESDYKYEEEDGRKYKKSGASLYQPSLDSRPNQRYYIEAPDGSLIIPPGNVFPEEKKDGAKIKPQSNGDKVWRWSVDTYLKQKHLLIFTEGSAKNPLLDENGNQARWNIYPKVYFDEDVESTLHPEDVIYDFPNSQGTKELNDLSIPFSFSKPTNLIAYLMRLVKGEKQIVLDFFAGSSTTADAVIRLNAEDGRNRKFIMVQLPEPCDEQSGAFRDGFRKISELSMERIRRAGKKVMNGTAHPDWNQDTGFRVFKIDTSNMADVYYSPDSLDKTNLDLFVDNIKPDRTAEDLLFEVMLDWGVDLALPIEKQSIQGKDVFFVDGDALAACFDAHGGIDEAFVKELATHKPLRVVFRDAGFKDSAVKINVEQIFKLLSPSTEVKSI